MDAASLVIVPASPLEAAMLESTARLRRTCRRLAGDAAEADDLFQETWVRALSRPPRDLSRDLGPWLDRVARNLSIDRYRRTGREELDDAPEARAAPDAEPPALIRQAASRAWVRALSVLGPVDRAVLLLRGVLEHDTQEVAEMLGMSEGAIRTRLYRARRAVAAHDGAAELPHAVLAALASARVCSVGDVAMLGRKAGSWRELWTGPAGDTVWRTLLELLTLCADDASASSKAYLTYLSGAQASREGRQDDARAMLLQARAHAEALQEHRLLWLIQHELAVVGLRAFDPSTVAEALQTLQHAPSAHGPHQTWLLGARANQAFRSGDVEAAAQLSEGALRRERPGRWRHRLQANLALYANQLGDTSRALQRVDDAIAALTAGDDVEALASAWNTRGMILHNLADADGAEAAFHTSIDLSGRVHGRREGFRAMGNLALLRVEQGRLEEAWALLTSAQQRNQDRNPRSTAINLANRALVAALAGQPDRAEALLDEAVRIAERIQELRFLAHACALRAAVRGARGDDPSDDLAVAQQHAHDSQDDVMATLRAVARSHAQPALAQQTHDALRSSDTPRGCTARLALLLLEKTLRERP